MPPVGKLIWRKAINKLLKNTIPIEAPESTKIDVQLKELLGDYINKIPGKRLERCITRIIIYRRKS